MPANLSGIIIHPDNAFEFDFIVNPGDSQLTPAQEKAEYTKLAKYFLASLTIPDQDQWVNLSPLEKNRIIKENFGQTEMGRDLLTQDYLLKQITSSLMYPESGLGKKFWDNVHARAFKEFGVSEVPVETFNKVWITPDVAEVYESGYTAYVVKSHLKVMLEEDYLSLQQHEGIADGTDRGHTLASQVIKEIILPELEKEINEGKNFAQVRQVFSAMILATWFKKTLKESLINKVYTDKAKVKGFEINPQSNEAIYQQYLLAFQKGVYNYIKEDFDEATQETIPRKYFSGGIHNGVLEVMNTTQVSSAVLNSLMNDKFKKVGIRLLNAAILAAVANFALPGNSMAQMDGVATPSEEMTAVDSANTGEDRLGDFIKDLESRQDEKVSENQAGAVESAQAVQVVDLALQDLIKEKASLAEEKAKIETDLPSGQVKPKEWKTTLGVQYHQMNNIPAPDYQLSLGLEGPIGKNISMGLGLRRGSFGGSNYQYDPLVRGDFTALDGYLTYEGSWTGRVSFTGLKGTLASKVPTAFQNLPYSLQYPGLSKNMREIVQNVSGLSLSLDAGKAFRISNGLVVASYAGANIWAVKSDWSSSVMGTAANASAYAGGIVNYKFAEGQDVQLYGYKTADVSHKDYSSNMDSFGLIPVANDYGIAYQSRNFSSELRQSNRLINNETQASVMYGQGNNQFRVNYKVLNSNYDYLLSSKTAQFEWNAQPFTDKGITFSLNLWASRKGSPYVPSFTAKGMMFSVSIGEAVTKNIDVKFNFGKGYRTDNDRRTFDVDQADRLARQVGSNNYILEYFLDHPSDMNYVLNKSSSFDNQTVFFAKATQRLATALSQGRNYNDFVNILSDEMNRANLTAEQKRTQILFYSALLDKKFWNNNMGKNEGMSVSATDPDVILGALRTGIAYNQFGRSADIPVVRTGGAAQFVSTFASDVSKKTGAGVSAFPSGVLTPYDNSGNFVNKGMAVFITPDGITYVDSRGFVFPTGAKDLETSRMILGAAMGIPQLYYEVAGKDGRHEGYGRTPGNILENFFPNSPEDVPQSVTDYYRGLAKSRIRLWEIQERMQQIDQKMKPATPTPQQPSPTPAASVSASSPVGGIDMNSANLDLLIKKDGNGVALPLAQQDLSLFDSMEGLVPHILEIQPLSSVSLFRN